MTLRLALVGVLACATIGVSCSDKPSPTAPSQSPTPTPTTGAVGLQITGNPTSSMGVGQTVYLRAAEVMTSGATSPVTGGVTWSSSSPGVASVGASGLLLAVGPGQATISASHLTHTTTVVVRVISNWADLDFRVAILNASSSPKPVGDVTRAFAVANDLLFERTGSRMRLIDMRDVQSGTAPGIATSYMDSSPPEQPDGLIIWSEDATAVGVGGFSQTLARPAPYANRVPSTSGANRLFVSSIHYEHKYARCGYDSTGDIRIGDRSANGECRNQAGLTCVNNGKYWTCPDSLYDFYAQPDIFVASMIVHEFMHPVGLAGNNDHYGTSTCQARMGMTPSESADHTRFQWHLGQCPDLFLRFRPTGAPAVAGRAR